MKNVDIWKGGAVSGRSQIVQPHFSRIPIHHKNLKSSEALIHYLPGRLAHVEK